MSATGLVRDTADQILDSPAVESSETAAGLDSAGHDRPLPVPDGAPQSISGLLKIAIAVSLSSPVVILAVCFVVQWWLGLIPASGGKLAGISMSRFYDALPFIFPSSHGAVL
jgi:hypothetical protein